MRATAAILWAAGVLALSATPANAAGAPQVVSSWVTEVTATGANLRAQLNPNGLATTYRFEYLSQSAFEAGGFASANKAPPSGAAPLGSGTSSLVVVQHIGGLIPETVYRYRVSATNKDGTTLGPERTLTTQATSLSFDLPEERGWELVSPIDKGGGAIAAPGELFGGGVLQAAAGGGAVTYGADTAFGEAQGAPPASQYVTRRASSDWATENVSAPLSSGAYGDQPDGAPYRIFSSDLSRALLYGGHSCRGEAEGCPAPNPPLPGTGAPAGYANYYLRENATGSFEALIGVSDLAHTSVSVESFEVFFAAATPDLSNVVLSSCAALSADATEVPAGAGKCDSAAQNLYLWAGSGLELLNLHPGDSEGTPGAQIAAPIGAVSDDGFRGYWRDPASGNLYLRNGNQTIQVDEALGGGGMFQAASSDGGVAFFAKAGHLYRFGATTKALTDLTPSGGVTGVLGISADGARVYFQDSAGLKLWHEGTITTIAPGASASAPSNYPPATATARVSADGEHLAFLSSAELTAYDNTAQTEVYLYGPPLGGGSAELICASCNPTGERAQGSSSIPGVLVNGTTHAYKPRVLASDGSRLYFDSNDELVGQDTNSQPDVYQWRAQGVGGCFLKVGCVALISSGRAIEGASFIDASANGSDAYFLTGESLVSEDPGSIDLYDARIGGGFPQAQKPIDCIADACQSLPAAPDDPTPGTLTPNAGNPPLRYFKQKQKKRKKDKGKKRRHRNHGKKKNTGHRSGTSALRSASSPRSQKEWGADL